MRGVKQPGVFQVGHDITDGRRRQQRVEAPRQSARADGLAGVDVGLDDMPQNRLRTLVDFVYQNHGSGVPAKFLACEGNVVTTRAFVNVTNGVNAAFDGNPVAR
jgi:hypothetical protein